MARFVAYEGGEGELLGVSRARVVSTRGTKGRMSTTRDLLGQGGVHPRERGESEEDEWMHVYMYIYENKRKECANPM